MDVALKNKSLKLFHVIYFNAFDKVMSSVYPIHCFNVSPSLIDLSHMAIS